MDARHREPVAGRAVGHHGEIESAGPAGKKLSTTTPAAKSPARSGPCLPHSGTKEFREIYPLRWRIRERMRRFLRPTLRRPFPDFFVPTRVSDCR